MSVPFNKDPVEYNQGKLLAANVFDLLPEDDDCFVYEDIFSQIDTRKIEEKYSIRGQHAYHPRLIIAILIYAYSQGIFSSRQIEKKCSKDLSFTYVSHRNCPNFMVLADFRKDNHKFFLECFHQSVMIAKGLGMVSLGHVSADGSKFNTSTSKHKAASYSHLKSNEKKLKRKIIVKSVFGQIKTGGFRRFILRGFKKAGGEFSLVCAVSNFKKIVNMIKAQTGCSKERELILQAT